MLEVVFHDYEKSWQTVYPVKFEYVRSEMHTQFANIANPSEIVIAVSFNIELGNSGGHFHVCLPYATIEPIRDILYSSMQGDQMEPDKRWVRMLSKQVQTAEVTLVAKLAQATVTCEQIMKMKAGDVLMLDIKSEISADVEGIPLCSCTYGVSKGKYAIKVEKITSPAAQDNITGD